MHEVGIMQEAIRLAVETAQAKGATRVNRLRLRVGALSGAVPDALRFAFDAVSIGTPVEGAVLDIEPVSACWWCAACAEEFRADGPLGECPHCRAWSGDLRAGKELEIASLEVI